MDDQFEGLNGKRIELLEMKDDPDPIEVGTQGTIIGVGKLEGWMQVHVKWDNGRTLSLAVPPDRFKYIDGSRDAGHAVQER